MDYDAKRQIIGRTIASIRKSQKLSQHKLADMACINEGYLCEVEKGIANATINKLLAISEALGVDVADLLRGV
ncbi:helix-turn-helix domain-containing protein [Raoultibacter phocaeensis]|uniref:helix-turn-helix domain-containing protein n=1 Tax=Raoultibacter phocaeensis TaxID=2479841 RepID=UPI001118798C|nr:helix-turn-helix transcriptional regulator [Raoultibacter phocaeensis]